MAGNPNWWSMQTHEPNQFSASSSSSSSSQFGVHGFMDSFPDTVSALYHLPVSQLLLGSGLAGEEDQRRFGGGSFQRQKKLGDSEDQNLNLNTSFTRVPFTDLKQELAQSTSHQLYESDEFPVNRLQGSWPPTFSFPSQFNTSLINNDLDFSGGKAVPDEGMKNHKPPRNRDHPYQCNSTRSATGGASKKAKAQNWSAQPALKVRKEKLGDRITALHQLVSPFGKTDTASVLSQAIGSIRFLQTQIQELCAPYMREQHPESRRDRGKDLRRRGLCLIPISCTNHIGNDTGSAANYWPPSSLVGGF